MRSVTLPSVHETMRQKLMGEFSVYHIDELVCVFSQDGRKTSYYLIISQIVDTLCECVCRSKMKHTRPVIFRYLGFALCECVYGSEMLHTHPVVFRCLGFVLCKYLHSLCLILI